MVTLLFLKHSRKKLTIPCTDTKSSLALKYVCNHQIPSDLLLQDKKKHEIHHFHGSNSHETYNSWNKLEVN